MPNFFGKVGRALTTPLSHHLLCVRHSCLVRLYRPTQWLCRCAFHGTLLARSLLAPLPRATLRTGETLEVVVNVDSLHRVHDTPCVGSKHDRSILHYRNYPPIRILHQSLAYHSLCLFTLIFLTNAPSKQGSQLARCRKFCRLPHPSAPFCAPRVFQTGASTRSTDRHFIPILCRNGVVHQRYLPLQLTDRLDKKSCV